MTVHDVIDAFRRLARDAESYPGRQIFPADIERTIQELEYSDLLAVTGSSNAADLRLVEQGREDAGFPDLFGGAA